MIDNQKTGRESQHQLIVLTHSPTDYLSHFVTPHGAISLIIELFIYLPAVDCQKLCWLDLSKDVQHLQLQLLSSRQIPALLPLLH